MLTRFKQLVVFHLAIATAFLVPSIPAFQGMPSPTAKKVYETIVSRGGNHAKFHWTKQNLVSSKNAQLTDAPQLLILRFDEDTASTFQSSPPSPVDYAVVLYELNQYGVRRVAISDPLFWDDAEDADSPINQLGLASLFQEMSPFERILLGSPVDRFVRPQPLGTAMQAAAIPLSHISGDISALPAANRLPFDFPIQLPEQVRLAPTHIDGQPDIGFGREDEMRMPLFIRWGDSVLPTFTMGLVLDLLGLSPAEIEIELGSHVKFATGNQIIIDEFGRAILKLTPANAPLQLSASDLLLEDGQDREPNQRLLDQSTLTLIAQTDQSPPPLTPDRSQVHSQRGDLLAHAANSLVANSAIEEVVGLRPAPKWIQWILLANIALIGAFLFGRNSGKTVGFFLLFIGLGAFLAYLALGLGIWTPVGPPLGAAITCLLAIPLLSWWKENRPDPPSGSEDTSPPQGQQPLPELVELSPDDHPKSD